MIEVEKNFQPTDEQLAKMLADSEFVAKKMLHDVYYDFEDVRLFRGHVKFRSRNGNFEIKIKNQTGENKEAKSETEIEDVEEIKKYFNTTKNLQEFVDSEMMIFCEYYNDRTEYHNGEFVIDVDKLSYGYGMVEIELMVDSIEKVSEAEEKIINFAKKYDFEIKDVPSKGVSYFKMVKPELYKKYYLNE